MRFDLGSLDGVFDHVAIAVADLPASERFYRTVLSVLGAEPSHADAELVEWKHWDIGATDSEHPVTRGLSGCWEHGPSPSCQLRWSSCLGRSAYGLWVGGWIWNRRPSVRITATRRTRAGGQGVRVGS